MDEERALHIAATSLSFIRKSPSPPPPYAPLIPDIPPGAPKLPDPLGGSAAPAGDRGASSTTTTTTRDAAPPPPPPPKPSLDRIASFYLDTLATLAASPVKV